MRQKFTRQENRKAWLMAAMIVLCMMLIIAFLWFAPSLDWGAQKASLPATSPLVQDAAQGLDSIVVDAMFDPEQKLLTATQVMTLRNPAGQDLDHVTLRSYSGAYLSEDTSPAATDELFLSCYGDMFSTGGLILNKAEIGGQSVQHQWGDDAKTVLTLPVDWKADETITVVLDYHVYIPDCASRFGVEDDIYALGNVFPTLAIWESGAFRTDAYIAIGDPFLTACANWTVQLALPGSYKVAATGYDPAPSVQGDMAWHSLTAPAVRDFALVISKDYQVVTSMADDVMLIACARNKANAQAMLKYARQAIECYESHYGPYAYPTLTLAQVSFPFGGMEYPRMVMIGTSAMADSLTLEYTVAHEAAHQWWYAMVGSDSYHQAWQDESLCEYALMDYIGQEYGAAARSDAAFERIETALRITVPRGVTPGSPIDYFQDLSEYTTVVYRRGAALWMALETHLGKSSLDSALREYQEAYRFRTATRQDLTDILSQAAGQDLSALMVDYLDTYMN